MYRYPEKNLKSQNENYCQFDNCSFSLSEPLKIVLATQNKRLIIMCIGCDWQVCLISDVIQHFVDQKVDFDASYVYDDVKGSVDYIHRSGLLHKKILADPAKYLKKSVRFRCFGPVCILFK